MKDNWIRMRVSIALAVYFAILMASGIVGIILIADNKSQFILWDSYPVAFAYYVANGIVGFGGLLSMLTGTRKGEFYSLICLSVLAVAAAILLTQKALPTAIGLMASPLILISFGWLRRQLNTSDIVRLNHLLQDGSKTDPDETEP